MVWYQDDEVQWVEEFEDPAEAKDRAAELRAELAVGLLSSVEACPVSHTAAGRPRTRPLGYFNAGSWQMSSRVLPSGSWKNSALAPMVSKTVGCGFKPRSSSRRRSAS